MKNTVQIDEKALRESIRRKLREGVEEPDGRSTALSKIALVLNFPDLSFATIDDNENRKGDVNTVVVPLITYDFPQCVDRAHDGDPYTNTPPWDEFESGRWGGNYTVDYFDVPGDMSEDEVMAVIPDIVNAHYDEVARAFENRAEHDDNPEDKYTIDMKATRSTPTETNTQETINNNNVVHMDENTLVRVVVEVARRMIAEGYVPVGGMSGEVKELVNWAGEDLENFVSEQAAAGYVDEEAVRSYAETIATRYAAINGSRGYEVPRETVEELTSTIINMINDARDNDLNALAEACVRRIRAGHRRTRK